MGKAWFLPLIVSLVVLHHHHHYHSCVGRELHTLGSGSTDYLTEHQLHNSKMNEDETKSKKKKISTNANSLLKRIKSMAINHLGKGNKAESSKSTEQDVETSAKEHPDATFKRIEETNVAIWNYCLAEKHTLHQLRQRLDSNDMMKHQKEDAVKKKLQSSLTTEEANRKTVQDKLSEIGEAYVSVAQLPPDSPYIELKELYGTTFVHLEELKTEHEAMINSLQEALGIPKTEWSGED